MHKPRLPRRVDLDDAVRTCASPPCGISEADPVCFGYWSKQEVLHFLTDLLESESIGAKAYAAIGHAAELHVTDMAFESELAQGAICVLLKKEIAARGGASSPRQSKMVVVPNLRCGLDAVIGFARCNQTRLSDMIEEAVLSISDSKLNAKLVYLLLLHRKQVEQLDTFRAQMTCM